MQNNGRLARLEAMIGEPDNDLVCVVQWTADNEVVRHWRPRTAADDDKPDIWVDWTVHTPEPTE